MKQMLILLSTVVTTASFALPSAYVKNTNLKQVKPGSSESSLIADTEDPNKVWVLPPSAGHAQLKNIVETQSASLCRGTKALLEGVSDLDEQRAQLMSAHKESREEAKALQKIVEQRRQELAEVESLPGGEEIKKLEIEIEDISEAIDELREKLLEVEDKDERDAIREEIKELKDERKLKKKDLRALKQEYRETFKKLKKAERRLDAAKKNLKEMNTHIKQIIADIEEVANGLLKTYSERAKLMGATAMVDYDSAWAREIANLSNNYRGLNFTKMPTYSARVHAGFIKLGSKDSYYMQLPPLAAYNVNGTTGLPYGERKKQGDPERANTAFPEVVAVDMFLNLVGACPAIDKTYFEKVDFDVKRDLKGVPLYAISTTYEYDTASVFEVKARYNLWKFYEKIVSRTTRGGFFSRRSFVNIMETKLGNDSFEIEVRNDGEVSKEEEQKIRKQVKAELVARVLNTVARPMSSGSNTNIENHEIPAASGAVVLANGLSKVCGLNVYCQVGGWILRAGDAIFGTTAAQTRFRQAWNFTAEEHWKTTSLVPKQGRTTYRR